MSDRPIQPGSEGQLYESDDAIAEDKRKSAVRGSLESLCGMESIQQLCIEFMGFTSNYITTNSVWAAEVRKVYAMPDAIASEPATDTDIIDRFIGDINETFLPALEARLKETREDLDQFMKDELAGELEECGVNVNVADAVFSLTEKGKEALREDLVSVIPVLEESQRTGITAGTLDAVKYIKKRLEDVGVN